MINRTVHVGEIPYTIRETSKTAVVLHNMTADAIHSIVEQLTLTIYPVTLDLVTAVLTSRRNKSITDKILQDLSVERYPYTTIKHINLTITPVKSLATRISQYVTIVV
jgi:hypothetical protein